MDSSGMKWLLLLIVYAAPPDAVDWDGPWELGMAHVVEQQFDTEEECRNEAIKMIGEIHQSMLAPIRFRCIPVASGLPEGAER